MGIPLVALNYQPQTPEQGAAQMQQLQTGQQQQQMNQQNLQTGALDLQMKQRMAADQQTIMKALAENDGDVAKTLPKLAGKVTPQSFQQLANFHLQTKKTLSEIADNDLKVQQDQHDRTVQLLVDASNIPDDQFAQAWPQIAQRNNEINPQHPLDPNQPMPKAQLPSMAIGLKTQEVALKQEAEKRQQATAATEQTKNTAQADKDAADAAKTRMETSGGMMTGAMAESKYRNILMAQQLKRPVSPEDLAFKTAFEKEKALVPTVNFRLQNAGATGTAGQPSAMAQAIANGQMKWQDVISARTPMSVKQALLAEVKSINPNFNSGDFTVEQKVKEQFTSGDVGKQLMAINTAREHMKTFRDLANALDNGDVQVLNKIGNAIGVQFGSDKTTNFRIAAQAFGGEVGRAFDGAGVVAGERKEAQDNFSAQMAKGQFRGAIDTVDKLLAGKQRSAQQSYKTGMQAKPNFGGDSTTGGKTLSMSAVQKAAKDHNVSVDEAKRQAEAAGYTVQ